MPLDPKFIHWNVLDHGFVRLVEAWGHGDQGVDMEAGIIEAARQSTQGSFRGWDEGDDKLLRFMYEHRHSTPFEFSGMVIEVRAPIFVFREWHRHRTQSYNEMSARYAPLPDNNYMPTVERCQLVQQGNKQAGRIKGAEVPHDHAAKSWLGELEDLYARAENVYQRGLWMGIPKEVARAAVPVGRYSQMRASANLRNWLGFLMLRLDKAAQWEIRQYAGVVAKIVAATFPRTWALMAKELVEQYEEPQ